MRRAIEVRSGRCGDAPPVVAFVTLPFDERHRRRFVMRDDAGEAFLLDLPRAALLADGDLLLIEGGGAILVRAAAEPVADLHTDGPEAAARLAWHIGNRHTPVQVLAGGAIRICDDHVLVDLAERHGAVVVRTLAPFSPEPGAYADAGHGHGDGHRHGQAEAPSHA